MTKIKATVVKMGKSTGFVRAQEQNKSEYWDAFWITGKFFFL